MEIIKNINNNFAVAKDKKGNTVIIRGKGIGFGSVPREADKSKIERSYYAVDENLLFLINSIPEDIISISTKIIDYARMVIDNPISSSIVFTLADHIDFAIKRFKKNMYIKLPFVYDIQHLYEKEYRVGLYGLNLLKKEMKQYLPMEEASYIAMHLINAEEQSKNKTLDDERVLEDIAMMIESEYDMKINRDSFNYSRFASHIFYLLQRGKTNHLIATDNKELFQKIKKNYKKSYECSEKIAIYLQDKLKILLNEEEKLYLMLHINRLCTREDCDQ